jgi:hypothetical protein
MTETSYNAWIQQNLEPDFILRGGNAKRYKPIPAFTEAELKEYYEKNKRYIEYNLKEHEERQDAYLRSHGL